MKIKKFNYVYEITYIDGKKYIGVRSCDCDISDDKYMGSGFHIPSEVKDTAIKTILSIHDTREDAMIEEIRLHSLYDVKNNPNYYNQCNSTSVKFQVSEEAIKRGAETRRGRTSDSHEYIKKQVESRRKYKGIENRTPAQRAADTDRDKIERANEKRRLLRGENQTDAQKAGRTIQASKIRGVKNKAKGHPGASSTSFTPWYYIDPLGNKYEIYDITKKDYAERLNVTLRQLINRFHYTNIDNVCKVGQLKGYTFGNIK